MSESKSEYVRPEEAAEFLGVSVQTLANWRCDGRGPDFYRAGTRKVLYHRDELRAWVKSTRARSTNERKSNP